MSINKLKNAWISTDTSLPNSCSFRNEGTSIFSGEVDISGQIVYTSTANVSNKNMQNLDLSTGSKTMDYLHNGRTYIIQTPDPTGTNALFLPLYMVLFTSMRYSVINRSSLYPVLITINPVNTNHVIYPAYIGTNNEYSYVLQPRQSVEIESDGYRGWYFREAARNNSTNTWNKVSQFNANVGVNKAPTYTLDVSGDINFTGSLLLNGSTYAPSPGSALLVSNNAWSGTNTFNNTVQIKDSNAVVKNLSDIFAQISLPVVGVDTQYTIGWDTYLNGTTIINGATHFNGPQTFIQDNYTNDKNLTNFFTGIDSSGTNYAVAYNISFNGAASFTSLPTSTISATTAYQLTNKSYVDAVVAGAGGSGAATLAGTNAFTGTSTYNINLPTSISTPTLGTQFTTKQYVDSQIGTPGALLVGNNTWSGTNQFNSHLPTSTISASTPYELCNKTYVDSVAGTVGGALLPSNNIWTGTNTFNTYLPTSTLTVSTDFQLTNKSYVDAAVAAATGSHLLTSNNVWSGTNAYNTILPTSTISATTAYQLTNKTYVDAAISAIPVGVSLSGTNAWTGTNTYNTNLPTSTISATTNYQLTNKTYVDAAVAAAPGSALLTSNNTWSGTNEYRNALTISTTGGSYENLGTQYNSAYESVLVNTTLTQAQSGRIIIVGGVSAITITLPSLGSISHGLWYMIMGDDTNTTTIRTLTDTIWGVSTSTTSFLLQPKQIVYLISNTGSGSPWWNTFKGSQTSGEELLAASQTWAGTNTFSTRIAGSISKAYIQGSTGYTAQRLIFATTIGIDNDLRASSTLTYDQTTDTLNATIAKVSNLTFSNTDQAVRIGSSAGYSNLGVSIGVYAGQGMTTANSGASVAIGYQAMQSAINSTGDVCIGTGSMAKYISGAGNSCFGNGGLAELLYGSSNTGIGAAAGSALVGGPAAADACNWNFAMGDSSQSNGYLEIYSSAQYTGITVSVAATTFTLTSPDPIYGGMYVSLYGPGGGTMATVVSMNTSTNLLTISTAATLSQNVWLYFYFPGTMGAYTYAGSTATSTTFTIATGLTITSAYRFSYHETSVLRKYTSIVSYNSTTGVIVLGATITMLGGSLYLTYDMNVAALRGLGFINNISCGKYSLSNVNGRNNGNTAFGVMALNGNGPASGGYDNVAYLQSDYSTAVGYNAGSNCTGASSHNTFIGAYSNVPDRTYNKINNSTAIGYQSTITTSNQMVFGTAAETVNIPGIFAPTTMNLNSTAQYGATLIKLSTNALTLTRSQSGSTVMISASGPTANIVITLPTGPDEGTWFKIGTLQVSWVGLINAGGTNTFSQTNNLGNQLLLYPSSYSTVEISYSTGVWYIISAYDVVRSKQQSFLYDQKICLGQQSSQVHMPWFISPNQITTTATGTITAPSYGIYIVNCAAAATITLPAIAAISPGMTIKFRKTGTLAVVISITGATGSTVMIANGITNVISPATTVLMSATQASAEVICVSSTAWAIM